MEYSMEIVRRIFDEKEGVSLEVGPDNEGFNCVELRPTGESGKTFYGNIELILNPEQAKLLGQALIDCAKETSDKIINSVD